MREADGSVDVGEEIPDPAPVEAVAPEPDPEPEPEPTQPPAPAPAPKQATPSDPSAWTEDEDRKILTGLFRDGLSQLACAKLVNRSDNATKFRLRVLQGLVDKRQAPPYAAQIIAELTGGAAPAKAPDPKPEPAKVEPSAAPAPAAPKPSEPASWTSLTLAQRALVKHLERLNDDFAPQDDLDIATGLFDGRKAPTIGADLGVTPEEVVARFKLMKHRDILDPKGHLTIDGQRDLIVALRYRVSAYEAALAEVVK
ncbi:hypothetical protein PE067_10445 [Paracoccus sp. DMF-8]|uniref:hypothetical protein n=1 Tax=Paracoccus sp. DMF-8 TaxID=3019445 RepID=UPI0023E83777|nr:hypothetical protein [Paracoccus sp. DMF-8]MDF3606519.1 hypothetical protein [Paracoccus sp. DMF-8]